MAPIALHGDYVSQPVRAVALMLKANNIDFEFVPMPLMPIADRKFATAEYAASVNPFKRVPTLVVEGAANICESSAALQYMADVKLSTGKGIKNLQVRLAPIVYNPTLQVHNFYLSSSAALQYLAELEGVPEHWYPRSVKERILVNTYLAWHGPDVRKYAMGYFVASFVGPAFIDTPFTKDQVDEAREGLESLLDKLEEIWLKESPFLAGNDITIADLQCITELTQVGSTGYGMVNGRPKLAAWIQRVKDTLKPCFDDVCKAPLTFFEDAFKKYKESNK